MRPLLWGTAVLLVGLLITLLVAQGLVDADEREAEELFDESAEQFTLGIEREVEGYFDELVDIGSFHAATRDASPEQFDRFVRGTGIFERLPALNGVVYLEVVPQGELDAYVARRRQIDPAFALLSLGATPEGRPHLLLSQYIPGADDLQLPRGTDISSITSISDVIAAANQSGSGSPARSRTIPCCSRWLRPPTSPRSRCCSAWTSSSGCRCTPSRATIGRRRSAGWRPRSTSSTGCWPPPPRTSRPTWAPA